MKIFEHATRLSIFLALLTTSLYIFQRNAPILVGSFRFLWGPLSVVLIILVRPDVLKNKAMLWLILYGLISLVLLQNTLWNHMSKWYRKELIEEFYALVVFLLIFLYYYIKNDYKGLARMTNVVFVFICITIVTTHIALFLNPLVVRNSVSSAYFTTYQQKIYKLTGAGGYGYMQSLVCLIPILVYYIKHNKRFIFGKKGIVFILFLILTLMVRAQVLANLIVTISITTLAFMKTKKVINSLLIITLTSVILLAIPISVYLKAISKINTHLENKSELHRKIDDLSIFIKNQRFDQSTEAGGRAERYPMLFKAFISEPIFGVSSYNSPYDYQLDVGGHLYWMSRLTIWGILGFIFWLSLLKKIYRMIRSLFDERFGYYYMLSITAFVALGLLKNVGGREPFLMLIVVIPGLYFNSTNIIVDKKI